MMNRLLSAKGNDITAWRAAADFAAQYRQTLLDLAASDHGGSSEAVFANTCSLLDASAHTHATLLAGLNSLIGEFATAPAHRHKELVVAFYTDLYRHFSRFRSAPVFYELSMAFLRQASAAIVTHAIAQLGDSVRMLPELALVAVGPAGRHEYSPFCPLQVLLVHGYAGEKHLAAIEQLSQLIHHGFDDAGLALDQEITPRNPEWRGTLTEWQRRCDAAEEHINSCRLADQFPLYSGNHLGEDLKQISYATLRDNSLAMTNLVQRMAALSNGLSLMGRLKLEHGLFRLLDNGLLPFSAALSTLSLIKNIPSVSTNGRINDLLMQRHVDVDLAERMLNTWHDLHNLRLWQERTFDMERNNDRMLYLDPGELSPGERHALKEALESVAIIQRHVEIMFSEMEA